MRIGSLRARWWSVALVLTGLSLQSVWAQPVRPATKTEPDQPLLDPDHYVDKEGQVVRRVWTTSKLRRWLESATAQYEALPSDADPESHEGRMRAALGLRIELFKELLSTRELAGGVGSAQQALETERERIEHELKLLQGAAEPRAPDEVDRDQLEAQEKRLAEARLKLADAERRTRERDERAQALPQERLEAGRRLDKAKQVLRELPGKMQSARTQAEKDYFDLLLRNARLEHRLAEEHLLWLEREQELIEEGRELDKQQVLRLQLELARVEQEVSLYRKAQGIQLEKKKKAVQADVVRMEEAVERASTPHEKLLATWQVRLAREQASLVELEQTVNRWSELEGEQDRGLQAEKTELDALQDLAEQSMGGRSAGLRLKMTYQRIKERRISQAQPVVPDLDEWLDRFRTLQLEVQEQLRHLDDGWSEQVEGAAAGLPESARAAFRSTAVGLREQVRSALMERSKLVDKAVGLGDRLEMLAVERSEILETLEDLVLSRVFWIRDALPLGGAVLAMLGGELEGLVDWSGSAISELFSGRLTADRPTSVLLMWIGLLAVLIPAFLVVLQSRIARAVRSRTEDPSGDPACLGHTWGQRTWTLLLATAGALPLPAYGLLMGWVVAGTGLVLGIDLVMSGLLVNVSVLLGIWLLARAWLGRRCLFELMFGMDADAASALYRFVRWLLLAYLVLMTPASIWQRPPFEFEALPRLTYTLFYLVALVAFWPLVRKNSPLVRTLTGGTSQSSWWRAWNLVAGAIMLLLVGILVMDVVGYRFGAARLARSAVLSLVTVFLFSAFYRLALQVLERAARNRARDRTDAPGEASDERAQEYDERLRRFIQTAFVVMGLVVITVYWGVGAGVVEALENLTVVSFQSGAGEPETVSVADLFSGLLILVITVWIVRNLKGLLDVFVFPRFQIAPGSRYAILTITRWALFVVGVLITLSAIHLDLGRIGWLVAAMGVGIGFGLQEIIANMVSGVILLVERPIRVGDLLTVGEISGEVRRINIRATTILNFDRQEVIVPNKDFITKEVTNWTLADKVLRLVIPIGVAYGSDIDQVREMLLGIAKAQPEVRARPAPRAFFMDHGESSLDFQLFVYLSDPDDRHLVRDRINSLINKGLAERGIEIPFPQRDLHVRSGELPVRLDGSPRPVSGR